MRLPDPYEDVDSLSRLIVFKCLRADRVPNVIEQIVAESLGNALIEKRFVDLSQAFEQSSAREPIILIETDDGSNGNAVHEFVDASGFGERFACSQRST